MLSSHGVQWLPKPLCKGHIPPRQQRNGNKMPPLHSDIPKFEHTRGTQGTERKEELEECSARRVGDGNPGKSRTAGWVLKDREQELRGHIMQRRLGTQKENWRLKKYVEHPTAWVQLNPCIETLLRGVKAGQEQR